MESTLSVAADLRALFDLVVRHEMRLWATVELAVENTVGLKLGSFQVLRALSQRDGEGRVHDVAHDLEITIGAASKIVDRLQTRTLVVRRPHRHDGRSSLIDLTPAGSTVLSAGLEAVDQTLRDHFAVVGQTGQGELSRLLETLVSRSARPEQVAS